MKELEAQLFEAEIYCFAILFCIVLWLYLHGVRHGKTRRIAEDLNARVKILELWPNQNDRINGHEERLQYLEKEMEALKHNPFTQNTLKRIK